MCQIDFHWSIRVDLKISAISWILRQIVWNKSKSQNCMAMKWKRKCVAPLACMDFLENLNFDRNYLRENIFTIHEIQFRKLNTIYFVNMRTSTVANQKHPKNVESNVIDFRLSTAFFFFIIFTFIVELYSKIPFYCFYCEDKYFVFGQRICWPSGGHQQNPSFVNHNLQFDREREKKWCTKVIVKTKRKQIRFLLFHYCEIVKCVVWCAMRSDYLCVCIRFQWHISIKRKAKSAFRFHRDYSIEHKSRANTIEINCSK